MSDIDYTNTAEIGDTIRAYDFEPIPGRAPLYVEGEVINKGMIKEAGFKGYEITVTKDADPDDGRVDEVVYVPFKYIFDFEGRVEKI